MLNQEAYAQIYAESERVQKEYYEEIAKLDISNPKFCKEFVRVQRYYNNILDHLTDGLLNERPVGFIKRDAHFAMNAKANTYCVDDDLKDYVSDNATSLVKRGLIKTYQGDVNCMLCGKRIIGLGLLDYEDAGTNAVCFSCIDSKHHYIGGGIYFTKFQTSNS